MADAKTAFKKGDYGGTARGTMDAVKARTHHAVESVKGSFAAHKAAKHPTDTSGSGIAPTAAGGGIAPTAGTIASAPLEGTTGTRSTLDSTARSEAAPPTNL